MHLSIFMQEVFVFGELASSRLLEMTKYAYNPSFLIFIILIDDHFVCLMNALLAFVQTLYVFLMITEYSLKTKFITFKCFILV